MKRNLTLAWLFVAAACGGKDKPATTTTTQTSEHAEHEGSGMEHENLTPELAAFHDLLAPRWHAEKGAQRTADTCGAIGDFKAKADAVAKATPPVPAHADTWTTGTQALVAAVGDLEGACSAKDDTKFEAAFAKVHESFHALMEQGEPEHHM
jgi:hypothetical protein